MGNVSIGVLIKAHGANTRTCATKAPPDLQGAGTKEPLVTAYIRTWSSQMLLDFYGASLPHKRAILAPIWCATLLHVAILWFNTMESQSERFAPKLYDLCHSGATGILWGRMPRKRPHPINKMPIGHIAHLRKQFKLINTFDNYEKKNVIGDLLFEHWNVLRNYFPL